MACAEEIGAGVDEQRIGFCPAQQAVDGHVGAGRRLGDDADPFVLEPGIADAGDVLEPAAAFGDQGICRPVIGNGHLRLVVALREFHDHIATV